MGGKTKVKLDAELLRRARKVAETAGYSSVEEFITHVLERELGKIGSEDQDEEALKERLRGLGYIS
jgi:hypothetical protein